MSHRLLILGSLGEFVQLVQKARARGIYTLVCDGYPDGPARQFADENHVIPVTDIEKIAELCRERQVDGIITSFSDLLLECMVKIADRAGIPCYLKPEQLPWYRDKSATKALLTELGLPTPEFRTVTSEEFQDISLLAKAVEGMHFPLVTKPLDKYGSRGICVIRSLEELMDASRKTFHFTDSKEILVEEYNDGYEFNLMSWVLDGNVQIISVADREKSPVADGEIPISTRNVYPSRLFDQVAQPAKELMQNFIGKTGQKDGALSMQFFWSPEKGIQVCEIAARFFGYEHELTDMVFGFNMEDLLLASVYDRDSLKSMLTAHDPAAPKQHGAVLYFQGRLKTIADLSAAEKLAHHPSVVKPWIFYQEGESVIAHGPNPYVALYYVAAPDRKSLDQVTETFFDKMTIPDPDGEEVLYQNVIPCYPENLH